MLSNSKSKYIILTQYPDNKNLENVESFPSELVIGIRPDGIVVCNEERVLNINLGTVKILPIFRNC
jgi:hypothetical protein